MARGYLNRPELTAEKFIANPFKEGERMYRTGDLGRWLADGNIEFIGRKDDQVKIRGYRIELGEIESALQDHEDIESVVVIAKANQNGDKELVAYLVSEAVLNTSDIRSYLSNRLPAYMLPNHFVQLAELPLTANGKIDKKALPEPEGLGLSTGVAYVAARNEIEGQLVAVYEEVLKKQPIGIKEDFFALGGDSIKSIQIVSRLRQRGYSLTIRDILLNPVIEELASQVKMVMRSIEQGLTEGIIALSPIQEWFFDSSSVNKHHYNQSVLLNSKEPVSEEGIRAALDKIVLHHDALRMVYRDSPQGWVQENRGKEQSYSLEIIEACNEESFNEHCNHIQSGINLEKGPLFKAGLFHSTGGDRLLLVAHHLVIDGLSWRILFEDLSSLYQQYLSGQSLALPLKTDSFKYWQDRQLAYSASEVLQKEETYWSAIESVPVTPLPLDNGAGSNLMKDVSSCSFLLDEEVTSRLLTRCYKAYHTEINDILLTGLSLAAAEVFGIDKVMIRLEGHGREDIGPDTDMSRTVGWFTTMYPVVFDMSYSGDMIRQLIEVKESLHRVPNKGIGYGVLRYLAKKEYRLTPEITFNYLGDFGGGIATRQGDPLFGFSGGYHGREFSEDMSRDTVLDVSGMVAEGKLRLSIAYSTGQYSASTIEGLLTSYQQRLQDLIGRLSAEQKIHLSPVDLTYKELSVEQLQKLNNLLC